MHAQYLVPDILLNIFHRLDRENLIAPSQVCHTWYNCVKAVHKSWANNTLIIGQAQRRAVFAGWDQVIGPLGSVLVYKPQQSSPKQGLYACDDYSDPRLTINGTAIVPLHIHNDYILTSNFAFRLSRLQKSSHAKRHRALVTAIYHQPKPSRQQRNMEHLIRRTQRWYHESVGLRQFLTEADPAGWFEYIATAKRIAQEKAEQRIAERREQQKIRECALSWQNSTQFNYNLGRCVRNIRDRVNLLQKMGHFDKANELQSSEATHAACSGRHCSLSINVGDR